MLMSDSVKVWVRALGQSCRVRVENDANATWLLDCLSRELSSVGLDQITIEQTKSGFMFQIPNSPENPLVTLESLLNKIPSVELMLEPEST